jgi:hypothetical protein
MKSIGHRGRFSHGIARRASERLVARAEVDGKLAIARDLPGLDYANVFGPLVESVTPGHEAVCMSINSEQLRIYPFQVTSRTALQLWAD